MTTGYVATLRNAQLDAITTFIGNAGKLRIYSGTRPATGGAITTLLGELTLGSPFAPGASAGVLTANSVTGDTSADATGTASWFRIFKSDGTTICLDGSVGTSGADLNLTSTSIVATEPINVTSLTITRGNP
jgi:hypothetical protein